MISLKIPHAVIAQYAKDIGVNVTDAIEKKFKQHDAGSVNLLKCELLFYETIALDTAAFLALTPSAIEAEFEALYTAIPDYAVLASGSLPKIERHIPLHLLPRYKKLWSKHRAGGKKERCLCLFCKVSARAESIFNWSKFTEKNPDAVPRESLAGKFVKSLALTVCPYCSRNYIAPLTEPTNAVYRPDLDHFYAQSIYPYFALCLYNLIPSCSACNCRIKGDADFMLNKYFHPYEHDAPEQLFVLDGAGVHNVQRIDASSAFLRLQTDIDERAKKSAEFFRLPLAYESHLREACHFADSLRLIPTAALQERARLLKVDLSYLMLILNRSDDPFDESYKHRALGKLMRDMQLLFQKP
ncbi:hypothetical protein INH39_05585 [Massilia violaceinigra]|uniref:HNH endonuclease n=1 Tax=Massilia violaceinigra TaxID=2045208 RepID=A0ABY4A8P2_9BURK|nr:hypothetical protein [Massilia violaceinigra]UOD31188.1 hypothetical protein INH39_05585 [Massilia violaceinigra]